ncbi:MAG: hypothetical protein DRI84_01705 [Bacteroidetes bacterium]|nr:MAG: hypothetical protein DRI84_01705 [Bacteroidota bacterium]
MRYLIYAFAAFCITQLSNQNTRLHHFVNRVFQTLST